MIAFLEPTNAMPRPRAILLIAATKMLCVLIMVPVVRAQEEPGPDQDTVPSYAAVAPEEVEVVELEHGAPSLQLHPMDRLPNIPAAHGAQQHFGALDDYRGRAWSMDEPPTLNQSFGVLDEDQRMWWSDVLPERLGFADETLAIHLGDLTQVALESSPLVKSILTEPMIRQAEVVIADADFDPTVFLEGKFVDTNEPVGNALTTGDNSDRFRDETLSTGMGLRRKTRNGGQLEISQRGGFQENNSLFLDPNPQATSRMEVNFTQPLLRDGGRAINQVRILLAQLDVQIANAQVRSRLEQHLTDVTTAYWELYQARVEWVQRTRLLQSAVQLQKVIEGRGSLDAQRRQILRAEVAVRTRESDLVRREARVRNAQSRLRYLTGTPQLANASHLELTPLDQPLTKRIPISARDSVVMALDNRADVAESIRKIHAISAQIGAAKNQVLPKLDLILGSYVAGLNANRNTLNAWRKQYSDGRPTYSIGMQYELPVRNRANKARLIRHRWEFSQAMNNFQQTMEKVFTEVEISVRETETAYAEMAAKQKSVLAASTEVKYLQQRWELMPDPNRSAVLLIEDLLDAQERLADEEQAFVAAQVNYAMSWIQLRQSMGILLRVGDIQEQACPSPESVDPNAAFSPVLVEEVPGQ